MSRRSVVSAAVAAAAAVAAVIAVSLVWPGLDSRDTPPAETDVWALQTGQGRRYARVNTAVGELDTVRSVANPSAVVQSGDDAYLFSQSYGKLTPIDQAMPIDLDDQALRESPSTPAGTVAAAVAGDYVAYRTDGGAVYAGTLSDGTAAPVEQAEDGADGQDYRADAIAVDERGTVYAYSSAQGSVLRYSIPQGRVRGSDAVPQAPGEGDLLLTAAGSTWFLIDVDSGRSWRRADSGPRTLTLAGDPVVGHARAGAQAAFIADEDGLVRLPADGGDPSRVAGQDGAALGTPARPLERDGVVYAAWLGAGSGTLWRSDTGEQPLSYGQERLSDDRRPVLSGTSAVIVNETRSGWVWDARTGRLLPSSQDWELQDRATTRAESSQEQAKVVIDPKPPVAVDDAFGVRPGALATLPVLLNDHDPNEDVLSIDPDSVTGLDPGFGRVRVVDQGQRLAVSVADTATGSATFRYRVTDGTSADGLYSKPATVTLTVADPGSDRAPRWCGVAGCLAEWPSPQVAPGGTITVPVLDGWVDPESDPVMLLSAVDTSGTGDVAATPDGDVVYQHADASATQPVTAQVAVTVADVHGRTATRTLAVHVRPDPQVRAESFTVVDTAGSSVTVDASAHVSGTAGRLSLSAVRVLDDADAEAATSSGTSFDFRAAQPGTYRVSYTVTDGHSEASATARITLLPADADAELATAPVVAFVRPQQDVTLDVFRAVSNPTHRVLLLSDVEPDRRDGANLSVDVVGQRYLRISGGTADGSPGMIGTISYVVSDGTDDAGARVRGQAGVYLLPAADEVAPIAVDDTVTVRAGSQIDIPVLENDVAAAGSTMVLNPAQVRSSSTKALAFASGRTLRYLAPKTPGHYRVQYGVYTAGSVTSADTADVDITVVGDEDENRAPRPPTLEGRVLTGQSTTISFHEYGVDPDGDPVTLDRVLTQPESGTAQVSSDGGSIEYSSVAGFHGQVSFTYRVVDARGAAGTATVRVGVLDEKANPSPVTFTDYVQVQVGEDASVRVSPLVNDIDPGGGTLRVTGVRPDAPETLADGEPNPEYERLEAMIASHDDEHVVIEPGSEASTASFLYEVDSSAGNTAQGLIVVRSVREAVPDYPVISDTQLTAQTRERFTDGIDVVSGHVRWSGGDVSELTLSLWGSPEDVTVTGTSISGPLPEHTRIIPFALSGTSVSGATVTSYGFLRIPGTRDLRLSLRADLAPQKVTEQDRVGWDMAAMVSMPTDAVLEVGDDVAASGARAHAVCRRGEGTRIVYEAGEGSPWRDACVVPVRIAGAQEWTYLSVPISVTALDPVPVLESASLTVSPGAHAEYDLTTLTSWQGRTDWDGLRYDVDYSGSSFTLERAGSTVKVTAADDASPGSEEVAVVTVTSHPGVPPGRLVLRVGAAPSQLPKGGTLSQTCSQASGSSCTLAVVGATGEVNPLPGTALTLTAVRSSGQCTGVRFSVADASHVRAQWSDDAPGQTCTAAFTLEDAQGRTTGSGRDGRLTLDLHGYPQTPASLTQTGYADGELTLRVDPGRSRAAYPALTGFRITEQGRTVARCDADGTCPTITAPNGEKRRYRAVAVNDVGTSRGSVETTAWAYDAPPAPGGVTASPQVTSDGSGQVVRLSVTGIDTARTAQLHITSDGGESIQVPVSRGQSTVVVPQYRIGSNTARRVTVTPTSRFTVPPGLDGSTTGTSVSVSANGVGAPRDLDLTVSAQPNADGTATVTAHASARSGGDGSTLRLGIAADSQRCTVTDDGGSAQFEVPLGGTYTYRACAESFVEGRSFGRVTTTAKTTARPGDVNRPEGFTFTVAATPHVEDGRARWLIEDEPTGPKPPAGAEVEFDRFPTGRFDRDPGIRVRYSWSGSSSDWAPVTPADGHAPYQVQAQWRLTRCEGGKDLQTDTGGSSKGVDVAFDTAHADYRDADGTRLSVPADGRVPDDAVSVSIDVTASWGRWGLQDAHGTATASCTPVPEPDPEPTPDPTESEQPTDPGDTGGDTGDQGTSGDQGDAGDQGTSGGQGTSGDQGDAGDQDGSDDSRGAGAQDASGDPAASGAVDPMAPAPQTPASVADGAVPRQEEHA